MTRHGPGRRLVRMNGRLAGILALAMLIGACTAAPTPSERPTPTASAEPTPTASPTPEPSESPTPTPTASPTAEPSTAISPTPAPGGFGIPSNPAADALFLVRDECRNPQDGYQLEFPEDWWTNTAIGKVPACSWFSPTFYEVPDPAALPDEIAIEIFVVPGDRGYHSRILSREDIIVGGTQDAVRLEIEGTADGSDGRSYEYVVRLGPTPESGPNLVARTDTAMGGSFDVSKGVMDRIMATIRFIGTVQAGSE